MPFLTHTLYLLFGKLISTSGFIENKGSPVLLPNVHTHTHILGKGDDPRKIWLFSQTHLEIHEPQA